MFMVIRKQVLFWPEHRVGAQSSFVKQIFTDPLVILSIPQVTRFVPSSHGAGAKKAGASSRFFSSLFL